MLELWNGDLLKVKNELEWTEYSESFGRHVLAMQSLKSSTMNVARLRSEPQRRVLCMKNPSQDFARGETHYKCV